MNIKPYIDTIVSFAKKLVNKYTNSKKKYKIGLPILLVFFVWYIFCLPSPLFKVPYSTVVSAKNGDLLGARISSDEQWRFPSVDTIPEKYKICLTHFEDKYFYYHWGVNPISVFRAVKQNLNGERIVSGASTITMQTIRMSRNQDRTFIEKGIEMILATRLEFSYSKDEILRLYASHAPMGGNVVGIDAASWRYFGHDAKTLSWGEAATLAVLPNSPSLMHFGRNRDKLLSKRNRLLDRLHKEGYMDEVDYELAVSEPLPMSPRQLPQIAPHLVTKLYKEEGGKDIATTIDRYYQEQTELILSRWNAEFSQNGVHNIAALIIDAEKNEIVAYCGNVNFNKKGYGNQVDIIQASRSTGSILKPFLYASMLQEGMLLPDQLLPDVPVNMSGFAPKNYSHQYDGAVPASGALARSLNVPLVVMLRDYSVPKFLNLLKKGEMTTLNRSSDDYGLSLVLGGAEGKLWEISNMYLKMVQSVNDYNDRGAYYHHNDPTYVLERSENIYDLAEDANPLFTAGAAWQTLNALTTVHRPEEIDWNLIPSIQKIAWKTGTSFGSRDAWTVGANSKYVVGVWVGNSDGEGRPALVGSRTAGLVMFDIFNTLPRSGWFARPTDDMIKVEVCKESGHLKGVNCPESSVKTVWVSPKGENGVSCPHHRLVHLSEDMRYQVYDECAGSRGIVHTSWFVLPPLWERYYKENNTSYRALPPYSPECRKEDETRLMDFIYPHSDVALTIPRQLDGTMSQIVFEVAHRLPHHTVFWHLDNEYIGETRDIHKKEYTPTKGKHRLTAVDENGTSISVRFTIH